MKKISLVALVCLLVLVTTSAFAGLGYTPEMAVSTLQNAYSNGEGDSDSITYDFFFDEETNTYFCLVTIDGLLKIAKACQAGTLTTDRWDKVIDAANGINTSVCDILKTFLDDDDYSVSLFMQEADEANTTLLVISDGALLYDAVNGVSVE